MSGDERRSRRNLTPEEQAATPAQQKTSYHLDAAPFDPIASLEAVQERYARMLPVRRLEVFWLLVVCPVLAWLSFANAPADTSVGFDLGFVTFKLGHTASLVVDALLGVAILAGLGYLLFAIVLTPALWPPFARDEVLLRQRYGRRLAPLARAVNSALVLVCVAGLVGVFAGVYLELGSTRGCFIPPVHHHVDAIYIAVTNFTLIGSSFTPHSGGCRLIVAGESVVALAVVAVGIAVLASRLVVQHQHPSVVPKDKKPPPAASKP
jgi:hypothetical protein